MRPFRTTLSTISLSLVFCTLLLACAEKADHSLAKLEADATTATDKGDYESAEKLLDRAVARAEGSTGIFELPNACEQLGLVYVKEGRHDDAYATFQKALSKLEVSSQANTELDVHEHILEDTLRLKLLMAEALSQAGKNDDAEKLFQQVMKEIDENTHVTHAVRARAVESYRAFQERVGHKEAARLLDEQFEFETNLPESQAEDFALAKRAFHKRDLPQAVQLFGAALTHTPKVNQKDLTDNVAWLSSCLIASGKLDQAQKQLSEVEGTLSAPLPKAQVNVFRAYVLELCGKHNEAALLFKANLGNVDTLEAFGPFLEICDGFHRTKELQDFSQWLCNAVETAGPPSQMAERAQLLCSFANTHDYPGLQRVYYEKAFAMSKKVTPAKPSLMASIYYGLSSAAGANREWQKAYELANRAVADTNGMPVKRQAVLYRNAGEYSERSSRYAEAAHFYQKAAALEDDPRLRESDLIHTGNECRWARDHKASVDWYRQALDEARKIKDPVLISSALAAYTEGLISLKEYDQASSQLDEAEAMNTHDEHTNVPLVIQSVRMHLCMSQRQYDKADVALDRALRALQESKVVQTPGLLYAFYLDCGTVKQGLKQYGQALAFYDKALKAVLGKLPPQDLRPCEVSYQQARCYFYMEQMDKADEYLKKSLTQAYGNKAKLLRSYELLVTCARRTKDDVAADEYSAKVAELKKSSKN